MLIDVADHRKLFPRCSRSKAFREFKVLRDAKNWKNRKNPILEEYCDWFDLNPDWVAEKLGFKKS